MNQPYQFYLHFINFINNFIKNEGHWTLGGKGILASKLPRP